MSTQPFMVMPPVYRFEFADYPAANAWGWHRATDLVDAVNNIRTLAALSKLTAEEIGREYPFLNPTYFSIAVESAYVDEDVRHGSLNPAPHMWLRDAIFYKRSFLPAKIGTLLLDAVKNPNKAKIRVAVAKLFS